MGSYGMFGISIKHVCFPGVFTFSDSETSTMGQYWHFMNLDKRQTTGDMGKLGEFLFSGYPSSEDFVEKFRIRPQIDAFLSVSKAREVNRRVNFRAMCK